MRIARLLTAAAVAAALVAAPDAVAATPHPNSCVAAVEGVATPANPANLVATGVVVTVTGQVECERDPLTTPPVEHASLYTGHIDLEVWADGGVHLCDFGYRAFTSVSSVLVMADAQSCVIPVTSPYRSRPMYARLRWATMPPYICCGERWAVVSPAGVGV